VLDGQVVNSYAGHIDADDGPARLRSWTGHQAMW
jgi:hypothetical protein